MNAAQAAISGAAILDNPAPEVTPSKPASFDYFKQVLPAPPMVCGLPLKPLSIGRYRRMRRQDVAFVSETERQPTAGDLLKGVIICSMTGAEYDEFVASNDVDKQVKKWAQRAGFLPPRYLDWPILGWLINKFVGPEVTQMRAEREAAYIMEQVVLFQEYILAAQTIPNYTQKENSPNRHSLHWSNSIELHLRSEQNWTSEEIEESPLSKALVDYFGYAESHGLISILTDADYEQAAHNAKQIELAVAAFAKQQEEAS